jgi:hyperosmotically inducible protein
MRRLTTLTFAVSLAAASIGCQSATNTNVANKPVNTNSNVAVVVPNNSNMAANTGSMTSSNSNSGMNYNMSRADYDKDKAKYEAEKGASKIGKGANDSWLWFKTKGALATTNDLRDSTIDVDVENDIVTLNGSVATKAEFDKAASVAKGIEGVKLVNNKLKVQAGDSMGNQMMGSNTKATNSNANMKK